MKLTSDILSALGVHHPISIAVSHEWYGCLNSIHIITTSPLLYFVNAMIAI
jgi:hypothetical protein